MTVVPHRQSCGPASRSVPPQGAGVLGGGPPGSAGVPPACIPVACRSVSLRLGTRPCRPERHGLGQSRVVEPLPVKPGGADGPGSAKIYAGGTPALPGGLNSMTSSQKRRFIALRVRSLFVFNSDRLFLPPMIRPVGQGLPLFPPDLLGVGGYPPPPPPPASRWRPSGLRRPAGNAPGR